MSPPFPGNIMTFYCRSHDYFSVIIPTFNEEQFIFGAIESALLQGTAVIEIIVVDNESQDRTVEIAKGFGGRVKVVSFSNKGVIAASRNYGASLASGEFLIFLDSDDLLLPRHCMIFAEKLHSKHRVNAITSDEMWVTNSSIRHIPLGLVAQSNAYQYLLANGNRFSTCSIAVRRSIFLAFAIGSLR